MSARRKPALTKGPLTLAEAHRGASIFDRYFSVEQQAQINRLQEAGDFEGETESEAVRKTIATLAAAALFMFGLDPIARDAFDRVSLVVFEDEDSNLINAIINEPAQAGEKWTRAQRAAELGETPRSAKAEEA